MARRLATGIPGLDKLIQGGFLENSVNLVTGETGTGKTMFACQFIWHGLQKGETGVYITLEEDPEDIREDARQFGWDFEKYEKKGLFNIIYHDPAQINNLGSVIIDEVKRLKAKRLVVDSTSVVGMSIEFPFQIRKVLLNIVNTIKRSECTAVLISESPEGSKMLTRFGIEEFVVDGVIMLRYSSIGERAFGLIEVRKMRRTKHAHGTFDIQISSDGMEVLVRRGPSIPMR